MLNIIQELVLIIKKKSLLFLLTSLLFISGCAESTLSDIKYVATAIYALGYSAIFMNPISYSLRLKLLKAEDYYSNKNEIEFCHAIEQDNLDKMNIYLRNGLDINAEGKSFQMRYLMWAFIKQNKKSFQYLLENKANPNAEYIDHQLDTKFTRIRPIMALLAESDDSSYLKKALINGGNPNLHDGNETLIFTAIESRRIDNLKLLITAGADINYFNKINKTTPLIKACSMDYYDIAYLLLEKGAKPEIFKNKLIYYLNNSFQIPYESLSAEAKYQYNNRDKLIKSIKNKGITLK